MADQDELRQLDGPRRHRAARTRSRRTVSISTRRSTRGPSSTRAAAYLELHIEQGPVLESLGLPLGVVLGTFGVERHRITWRGQAAHAGSTPMDKRRDALAGAAKLALEIRDIARANRRWRRLHVGRRRLQARNRDVRRRDGRAAPRSARPRTRSGSRRCSPRRRRRASGSPRRSRSRSSGSGSGRSSRSSSTRRSSASARRPSATSPASRTGLPSGPLHDAAEVSRAGVPTVMLFVQSLRGLSHTKLEDTTRGAPRARRRRARPPGVEDDRLGRRRRRALTARPLDQRSAVIHGGVQPRHVASWGRRGTRRRGCLTWNVSNVGAVADPLAEHYGVSLAAVGLLTTALFVTHLAVQLPAGRGADRFGSRRIALLAIAAGVVGNVILLVDAGFGLALFGRAVVGHRFRSRVRGRARPRPRGRRATALQGLYGGATMVGGGLALMVVPPLTDATSWRAPYWSGSSPVASRRSSRRSPPSAFHASATPASGCVRDRQSAPNRRATGSDVRARRRRRELGRPAPRAPGRELGGSRTRRRAHPLRRHRHPSGRRAPGRTRERATNRRRRPPRNVARSSRCSPSAGRSPSPPSARSCLGSAGLSFAVIFAAAQRARPDAPGAAIALVNACAVLTVVIGTPLAGLAFELPSDGRLAFVVIAALGAATLIPLRAMRL